MLNYFINKDRLLHVLDLAPNVLYKASSNARLYAFADKEAHVLILIDLLKVKTILKHQSEESVESYYSNVKMRHFLAFALRNNSRQQCGYRRSI